jgi:hypothetical protein
MRVLTMVSVLTLTLPVLGGCNTGVPEGVLPREPVPPPPSLSSGNAKPEAASRTGMAPQRRAITIPSRLEPRRPS